MDKHIDLGIATISGRYPDEGYGVNLISKELIYVIEGSGTLNFENKKIEFSEGDSILIEPNEKYYYDDFTKIDFVYLDAVASLKVGQGVKSEGELVVSGTNGYIYVPAPWWKTEYFEVRFERAENNRRYFYQLDGEGIRYEIVSFVNAIEKGRNNMAVSEDISIEIARVIDDFICEKDIVKLQY